MIYEVEFKDEKDPLVFKMVDRYGPFVQEFMTLLQCERLKIQAPRIKGLLGVGTNCGGFVMTKIQASFCLDDCHSKSINSTLDDRKRWYQQILDALQALHRVDYIWGDAKPANVLINEDGDACLIDFEGGTALAGLMMNFPTLQLETYRRLGGFGNS
jgi:serine/threonine protein kinase